jgi:NAD(P)-dependent dehydrogenase (short-subunit alcohol dehydrogenase family)
MTRLGNKTCLITGAASGLGRSLALAAAARGSALVLTDIAAEGLHRTAQEVRDRGGEVRLAQPVDVTDYDAVRELARTVHTELGSVDLLMNVAGVSAWGPVDRLTHQHWQRMVDVNLMGPIHMIEAFVPPMIEAGRGGHLVNVSSAAGLFGLPWHAAYSASKFGLRGVSEVLRFDLRQHRIAVSLVCPGAVDTPLVGTVDLVGIDRTNPRTQRMVDLFTRHAVSPDRAAHLIVEGVERNRYMIYTSRDIQIGHWIQRVFPPPYELTMRALNWSWARFADRHA